MRGPEAIAIPAPVLENAEFFGIIFELGTFMPHLPLNRLIDKEIHLPEATSQSFWLHGAAWQFPDYENVDTFVERLVRDGLLVQDGVVEAVLQDRPQALSMRSVRRRFLRATGLTHSYIRQIERARHAMTLLQQGVFIVDTVLSWLFRSGAHDTVTEALGWANTGSNPSREPAVCVNVPFIQDSGLLAG